MNLEFYAPLRLSLAGGGTDLPECYLKSGAHLLAVSLKLKVKVSVGTDIKHDSTQLNDLFKKEHPNFNVNIKSEVSPGAGLGGSGAVAVALVAASNFLKKGKIETPLDIGLKAYKWEREILNQPVGFQDQLASAVGGCVEMVANSNGEISVKKRNDLLDGLAYLFEHNFVLVETGIRRNASKILKSLGASYVDGTDDSRPASVEEVEKAILLKDGEMFGDILRRHWAAKCKRLPEATTDTIDTIIQTAIEEGASGAKAIGAGAGGFVLISGKSETRTQVINALKKLEFKIVETTVSTEGVNKVKEFKLK